MKFVLIAISLLNLIMSCQLDTMAMKRINKDLQPFINGITQQMIQKVLTHNQTCLVQVKHHQIISDCLQHYHQQFLNKIALQLPNLKFVINYSDAPRVYKNKCNKTENWINCSCDKDYKWTKDHGFFFRKNYLKQDPIYQHLPIFSPGTISACFTDILMPSHLHVNNIFDIEQPQVKWNQKKFAGVWRGSTTGGQFFSLEPHYSKFHRQKFVGICQKLPYCDARFFQYYQCSPKVCKAMRDQYGQRHFMPYSQMYKYKIIIDIDGNTYSARFPAVLRESGSVILKIALFQDLGYILTQPWKHYIPVKMDLSDFEEKMEWAKTHDKQLQNIAMRGHKRAMEVLKQRDFECYMITLLTKYASLLAKGCNRSKLTAN